MQFSNNLSAGHQYATRQDLEKLREDLLANKLITDELTRKEFDQVRKDLNRYATKY